ncbi:succinyl-diaminopimelate desuccinylase [Gracilibacillus ureilyticus]|uniref:Succinyl-diaminopimelate desuccinylase n=1 Tax=Gracilibacillus ureilyticus TaxID=531814 RepID=A0A1H9NAD7_9BACI|nr:M20/M25/M40 family metallo-hydrolase [Gracilibacillus ureilyticus]SER32914.1 succinyl-diaminopimelate desuccinylase [Gracilibacillus ureilyticus]
MGDQLVQLLEELIEIDSSTKDGANHAIDYCAEWLKDRGLQVKRVSNQGYRSLVCTIGEGEQTIVLNGHVDVIEGEKDQFRPFSRNNKMYGRGSIDMKAGVAAMMVTVAELKDRKLPAKVMLQLVPDEEKGGRYGSKYLADQGYYGDFMICGEPTNLGISVQSKGVLQLDFKIHGKPSHGSRPWDGVNAILKAYQLYEDILRLPFAEETDPPFFDKPSINLARLSGGTVYNKVPELCEMALDIRYLPKQNPDEIYQQIKEITDGEVNIHICNEPVKTKADHPYVKLLESSIRKETQLEDVKVFGQHGSSDAQFFTKYGTAAVEFGPVGADWHGEDEMVYIDSVKEYVNILKEFVQTEVAASDKEALFQAKN